MESSPASPLMKSVPGPPQIRSAPPRPLTWSSPAPAAITSSPEVPKSLSSPGVPLIVAGRPRQVAAGAAPGADPAPRSAARQSIDAATQAAEIPRMRGILRPLGADPHTYTGRSRLTGQSMRAAAAQLNSTTDRARNLEIAERVVRGAAADGAELVVLPEKWNLLGAGEELLASAERLDGPSL